MNNAYSKKAAYSLGSIEEAKQISKALGGTVWYHEGAKSYSIGTGWSISDNVTGKWLCNQETEADAIAFAKRCKSAKVERFTTIYLDCGTGDPFDDELIENEAVTIWQK